MVSYKIEIAAVCLIDLAVFIIGLFCLPVFGLWLIAHMLGVLMILYLLHTSVACDTINQK